MKKAYLSIASLLACITLASCNSGEVTSSNSTTPSESTTTSSENTTSSSVADVFTYKLELEAPSVTTYEVGDVFDFASIVVKEQTFKNGTAEGGAKTLARSEFVVKGMVKSSKETSLLLAQARLNSLSLAPLIPKRLQPSN